MEIWYNEPCYLLLILRLQAYKTLPTSHGPSPYLHAQLVLLDSRKQAHDEQGTCHNSGPQPDMQHILVEAGLRR